MRRNWIKLLQNIALFCVLALSTGCTAWVSALTSGKPFAILSNAPATVSDSEAVNIDISGDSLVSYRYKLGLASAINCADAVGYSTASYAIGTPISESMTTFPESEMKLCVIAMSSRGIEQLPTNASVTTWFNDTNLNTISLSESYQAAAETDSTVKHFRVNSSIVKPYDVQVSYSLSGDAVKGTDHDLATTGTVTIPAGQTTGITTFRVYRNTGASISKDIHFKIFDTNRKTATLASGRMARFVISDVDTVRPTVVSLSSSALNSCTVLSDGVLKCWGANANGEVGNGTFTPRSTPQVIDNGTLYDQVAVGGSTVCGIVKTTGVLKCWGYNGNYQLANGSTTASANPVVVDAGTAYKKIYPGATMCGITTANVAKCWGSNANTSVGDGLWVTRQTPYALGGALRFKSLSVGSTSSCGITTTDQVYCWGQNYLGQLGDGTTTTRGTPAIIAVPGVDTFSSVSVYATMGCAHRNSDGALVCWGFNYAGAVGDGTTTTRATPVTVLSGASVKSFAMSGNHTCAITSGDALYCWGANWAGQIGVGTTVDILNATLIEPASSFANVIITPGQSSTCASTTSGVFKCWGYNNYLLGDGTSTSRATPVVIDTVGYKFRVIGSDGGTGSLMGCGLTTAGDVKCWGTNNQGEVGDGTVSANLIPAPLGDGGTAYAKLSHGSSAACGITTSGVLKCWGSNTSGQLGLGHRISQNSPVVVDAGTLYSKVDIKGSTGCAITASGALKCWGVNGSGQMGTGSTTSSPTPVLVDSGTMYSKIAMDGSTTCGITTGGVLKCWGANANGQVGNNSTANQLLPAVIDAGTFYSYVAIESGSVCGLTSKKALKCWGKGTSGQIGNAASANVLTPALVDSGVLYDSIVEASGTTCGITDGGVLKCWGLNSNGQVGNSSTTNANTPQIVNSGTLYSKVFLGTSAACGIVQTTGALKCWGLNVSGMLGLGHNTVTNTTPAVVDSGTSYSAVAFYFRMCALTTGGVVKCAGNGPNGELGNSSYVARNTLAPVTDTSVYRSLINGVNTFCGITDTGQARCWGWNIEGSQGTGIDSYVVAPRNIMKWLTP